MKTEVSDTSLHFAHFRIRRATKLHSVLQSVEGGSQKYFTLRNRLFHLFITVLQKNEVLTSIIQFRTPKKLNGTCSNTAPYSGQFLILHKFPRTPTCLSFFYFPSPLYLFTVAFQIIILGLPHFGGARQRIYGSFSVYITTLCATEIISWFLRFKYLALLWSNAY